MGSFYAVKIGLRPGVYEGWFGIGGAFEQVNNYPNAKYRQFFTQDEAEDWLDDEGQTTLPAQPRPILDGIGVIVTLIPTGSTEATGEYVATGRYETREAKEAERLAIDEFWTDELSARGTPYCITLEIGF